MSIRDGKTDVETVGEIVVDDRWNYKPTERRVRRTRGDAERGV
jgi:hypothetical protein